MRLLDASDGVFLHLRTHGRVLWPRSLLKTMSISISTDVLINQILILIRSNLWKILKTSVHISETTQKEYYKLLQSNQCNASHNYVYCCIQNCNITFNVNIAPWVNHEGGLPTSSSSYSRQSQWWARLAFLRFQYSRNVTATTIKYPIITQPWLWN